MGSKKEDTNGVSISPKKMKKSEQDLIDLNMKLRKLLADPETELKSVIECFNNIKKIYKLINPEDPNVPRSKPPKYLIKSVGLLDRFINEFEVVGSPDPYQRTLIRSVQDFTIMEDIESKIDKFKKNPELLDEQDEIEMDGGSGSIWMNWKAIATVLLIVVIIFQRFTLVNDPVLNTTSMDNGIDWEQLRLYFTDEIKHHKMINFPKQTRPTFTSLLSAVHTTMSDTIPRQPSCIVVLTPPSVDLSFSQCFSKKIAESVNKAFSLKYSSTSIHGQGTTIKVKQYGLNDFVGSSNNTKIHEDINNALQWSKAIVVNDIDKFEKEAHLLIFHSFCDNYMAKDKRATFLFPIPVPKDIFEKHEWNHIKGGDISFDVLNTAWASALSDDKRPAQIARVAATVILLEEGDTCN